MRYILALALFAFVILSAFALDPAQQKAIDNHQKVQAAKSYCDKEKLKVKAKSPTTLLGEQAAAFAVCMAKKDIK